MYPDKLYRLAFDFYDIAPWKYLVSSQLFAFFSPALNQNIYCLVTGQSGEYPSITGVYGNDALQTVYRLNDTTFDVTDPFSDDFPTGDVSFLPLLGSTIQCGFVSTQDNQYEDQLDDLNTYLKKYNETVTGQKDIPIFVEKTPMRHPYTLRDPQRIQALEEMLTVFMSLEHHFGKHFYGLPILSMTGESVSIPFFRYEDGKWNMSTLPVEPYKLKIDPIPFNNDLLIQRLKKLPRKDSLDCLFTVSPATIAEDDHFAIPEAVFCYCQPRKIFPSPALALRSVDEDDATAWTKLVNQLCQSVFIEQLQFVPKTIYYSGRFTCALLSDLCQKLNIPLFKKQYIPELEHMIQDMASSLSSPGPEGENTQMEQMAKMLIEAADKVDLRNLPPQMEQMIRHFPLEMLTPDTAAQFRKLQKRLR